LENNALQLFMYLFIYFLRWRFIGLLVFANYFYLILAIFDHLKIGKHHLINYPDITLF